MAKEKLEIYKITNQKNGKIYIGLTIQGWKTRVKKHFADATNGCEFKLHRAIRKYGSEHFESVLLETCKSYEHLKEREMFWINILNITDDRFGYNMTLGGDGTLGRKHSEGTKNLMRNKALNSNNNSHMPVEVRDGASSIIYKSIRAASNAVRINRHKIAYLLYKYKSFETDNLLFIARPDLKTPPKPRRLGRDPKQVKAHMIMMQEKSKEARKANAKEFSNKMREAKKGKAKPLYQFDLEGNLIKKHQSSRIAAEVSGISRGGIRNCIRNKSYICRGFIWSDSKDISEILELINNK